MRCNEAGRKTWKMAAEHVDQNVLVKFAQKLAGNEKKFRDRAVKKLRKWLETRSQSSIGIEISVK